MLLVFFIIWPANPPLPKAPTNAPQEARPNSTNSNHDPETLTKSWLANLPPLPRGSLSKAPYPSKSCHGRSQEEPPPEHYLERYHRGLRLIWSPELFELDEVDKLLRFADLALDDAAKVLGTPRRAGLTMVFRPNLKNLKYKPSTLEFTLGFYDGSVQISTLRSRQKIETVLKHELLHAQLDSVEGCAPMWFHEGLATAFQGDIAPVAPWWMLMLTNRTWIPFSSLSRFFSDFETGQDAALAYSQSLAMVMFLIHERGKEAIPDAVQHLRLLDSGENLWDTLMPGKGGPELIAYLSSTAPKT